MGKVTQINVSGTGTEPRQVHLREIGGDFDAPLGTIGQELRGARISRGEDLTTVSRVLKIRKEHLEALEDDNLSGLPGRTYAVGFIRAYAEYLGLNVGDAVERFKTEIAGRDQAPGNAGFTEPYEEPRMSRGWIVIAIVFLGLAAYGVYYLFFPGSERARQPVAAVPTQMVEKPQAPVHHAVPPKAATPAPATPSIPAPQTTPPAHAAVAPGPGGELYGRWNANPRIVLQIKQPTHILVQDEDGKTYINRILHPGDIYQVANHPGLSLTTEHGNAVELNIDGKQVGTVGASADAVAALPLDPQKLSAAHAGNPGH